MDSILVSCGYCKKLPQTVWLQTIGMYSLTVLVATSLKSGCQQGHTLSGGSGETAFLPFPASRGFRSPLTCGYMTPVSALWPQCLLVFSVSSPLSQISLCLSHIKTLVIRFRVQLDNPDDLLSQELQLYLQNLFPNNVTFTGSRD